MKDTALARGMLILKEAQLNTLLAQGYIELDAPEPVETVPRDEGISELRSLLAQPASRDTWLAITQLVDAAPEDQLHELIPYVQSHLTRWDDAPRHTRAWTEDQPFYEPCLAPETWRSSMIQALSSPKYQLVRALSFDKLNIKNADMVNVLKLDSLTHLRCLDLGRDNKFAANMWKALLNSPATANLQELRIASALDTHVKGLSGPHNLTKLTHVHLHYCFSKYDLSALQALFNTDWMQQIDTMTLEEFGGRIYNTPDPHNAPKLFDELPKLSRVKRLNIDAKCWIRPLSDMLEANLPYDEIGLLSDLYMPEENEFIGLCQTTPLQSHSLLDLSALHHVPDGWLIKHLPGCPLLSRFSRVHLGHLWTPELTKAIEAHSTLAPPT
jgi:hypothetical protein